LSTKIGDSRHNILSSLLEHRESQSFLSLLQIFTGWKKMNVSKQQNKWENFISYRSYIPYNTVAEIGVPYSCTVLLIRTCWMIDLLPGF
jgi:hypothetical protein